MPTGKYLFHPSEKKEQQLFVTNGGYYSDLYIMLMKTPGKRNHGRQRTRISVI